MKISYRILSAFLAVLMIFVSLPATAFAKKNNEDPKPGKNEFRCDWFDETIIYPYEYSDSYFTGNAYDYNHELALYSLCVSMASFGSFDLANPDENIRMMLEECGYEFTSYGYDTEGYDTVGLALGTKKLELNGEPTTIVIAAIRSGNYGMEWGGNLRVGTGENHEGFNISKKTALVYFNDFCKNFRPYGKVKLLVPGYSRGSSIANLFAAELIDGSYTESIGTLPDYIKNSGFTNENIYAYLYETPQATSDIRSGDEIYHNIFNIINPSDYVPMFVMDNFRFTSYGKTLYLPSASRVADYDSYYNAAIEEFESFMSHTGKKHDDFFYDAEESLSCELVFKKVFSYLATEVMVDRATYSERYENSLIFFTGQYLGKKRTVKDLAGSIGKMIFATVVSLIPSNYEKIKEDGYQSYLADYVAEKTKHADLSDKEVEGLIDIFIEVLDLVKEHRREIPTLLSQINTVINVHQPYVTMTWVRILDGDTMLAINSDAGDKLRLSWNNIKLKYNSSGKLNTDFNVEGGYVKWSSDNNAIASVDEDGTVYANSKGTATLTATLYSSDGKVLDEAFATVTVEMNAIQVIIHKIKNVFV
ncbi:MAG: Ig-like domain-containing protein [Clostridia bacterium]|nr:Ig-like domain-containing protein [Clostridia bacterium]